MATKWSTAFMGFPWSTLAVHGVSIGKRPRNSRWKTGPLLSSLLIRCIVVLKGKRGPSSHSSSACLSTSYLTGGVLRSGHNILGFQSYSFCGNSWSYCWWSNELISGKNMITQSLLIWLRSCRKRKTETSDSCWKNMFFSLGFATFLSHMMFNGICSDFKLFVGHDCGY